MQDVFYTSSKFERYSNEYFVALISLIVVSITIIWYGKKASNQTRNNIQKCISYVLSSMIILWVIIEISLGRFYLETDLPLIFCNLVALLLPLYLLNRRQILFDLLYYIILAGAIQAIITPGLKFSFPHYEFIKFWSVHMGLITFILFEMIVFNKKPTFKGVFKTFLLIQVYVVFIMLINWILGANYLFLNIKPEHGTLLDSLGGWPWYIIWMDLILIPYFFILYLPSWLINKSRI